MATNDKYDRQLRLWGSNGQTCLMNSHVLLVNADAVGAETLKNLVLPGVKQFTVLDENLVTFDDISSNFFVSEDYLGKSRAETVKEMLCEMNPDVEGFARSSKIDFVVSTEPQFFSQFQIVVTANLPEITLLAISQLTKKNGIPLLHLKSYGLIGLVRLQFSNHEIIESRPESDPFDLRLANPFPELQEYCSSIDLTSLNDMEFAHVPWVVLLVQAVTCWKNKYDKLPTTSTEKNEFRNHTIPSLRPTLSSSTVIPNNVLEAQRECYRCFSVRKLPDDLVQLLQCPLTQNITPSSSDFRIMLHALSLYLRDTNRHRELLSSSTIPSSSSSSHQPIISNTNNNVAVAGGRGEEEGVQVVPPPLAGQLPDMTASTATFIELQQVYQKKASSDRTLLTSYIHQILKNLGRQSDSNNCNNNNSNSSPTIINSNISTETIDTFCRNVYNLQTLTTSTIISEVEHHVEVEGKDISDLSRTNGNQSSMECLSMLEPYDDALQTPILWYIALRGVDSFYRKYHRYPTVVVPSLPLSSSPSQQQEFTDLTEDDLSTDIKPLYSEILTIANSFGLTSEVCGEVLGHSEAISLDLAKEMCRYAGGEVHFISALLGGVAAQEVIKLLTKQYVPLNNTYVYNGIAGCGAVYQL